MDNLEEYKKLEEGIHNGEYDMFSDSNDMDKVAFLEGYMGKEAKDFRWRDLAPYLGAGLGIVGGKYLGSAIGGGTKSGIAGALIGGGLGAGAGELTRRGMDAHDIAKLLLNKYVEHQTGTDLDTYKKRAEQSSVPKAVEIK